MTKNPNIPSETTPAPLDPTATYGGLSAETAAKVIDLYVIKRQPRRAVAKALRISPEAVEKCSWFAEPVAFPSLRFAPTAEALAERVGQPDGFGRTSAPRWDRLAARCGLTVGKARDLFTTATGHDSSTRYPGKGRRHAETRVGRMSPDEFKPVRTAIRAAKATGIHGDARIVAKAQEILEEQATEAAKPKRARAAK